MRPEAKIEEHLITRCKALGFLHYKFTAPSTRGVPDRIIIGNSRTVFLELKAPGKKPRRSQEVVINDILNHGGTACYTDSTEGVDEILNIIATTKENHRLIIPEKYLSDDRPRFLLTIE